MSRAPRHFVLLSGGIGGAKLARGLHQALDHGELTIIANTGDDFRHLGLHISPDIDTLIYTLAGIVNQATGWGRRAERWRCMEALEELGGPTWFRLGDRDLATHLERTRRLANGATLTEVTGALCEQLGTAANIVPMSDDPVQTRLETDAGELEFQDYFVRRAARPRVRRIFYRGAETARANPEALTALSQNDLSGILLAPSNPYLSIDPILAVPGLREAIANADAPRIAVSPIVGGDAIKGPTAKIMRELGVEVSPAAIAEHYRGVIDQLVIDRQDAALKPHIERGGPGVTVCDSVMTTDADKLALARHVIECCQQNS